MAWWGWLLGILGMIALWALVVWAIWYFVTAVVRHPESARRNGNPKGILDERLARGEIGVEEYRRLRELLASDADPPAKGQEPVESGERR